MSTQEINLGEFNIGSTDRLEALLKKDGEVWDLSSGSPTVTITFEKPDRVTQFTRSMTSDDPDTGVFYYDTTTTEIDEVGWWTANVRVTQGAIVKRYPYTIRFHVNDQP